MEIVIIVSDLSVSGQDLAHTDSLCAELDTGVIGHTFDLEPAAAEVALVTESEILVLDLLDSVFVVFAACIIISVIFAAIIIRTILFFHSFKNINLFLRF